MSLGIGLLARTLQRFFYDVDHQFLDSNGVLGGAISQDYGLRVGSIWYHGWSSHGPDIQTWPDDGSGRRRSTHSWALDACHGVSWVKRTNRSIPTDSLRQTVRRLSHLRLLLRYVWVARSGPRFGFTFVGTHRGGAVIFLFLLRYHGGDGSAR